VDIATTSIPARASTPRWNDDLNPNHQTSPLKGGAQKIVNQPFFVHSIETATSGVPTYW